MTARSLDHYERRAIHDIQSWVRGDRGRLDALTDTWGSAAGRLGKPIEWAVDRAFGDDRVRDALASALDRTTEGLSRYMTESMPVDAATTAYGLDTHGDIADLDLQVVDRRLKSVRDRHRALFIGMGAAEGAAGVAGLPTAIVAFIASIPAMQAASLRAVADISRHTGFDPTDFAEREFVVEIAFRSLDVTGRGRDATVSRLLDLGQNVAARQSLDQLQQAAVISALRDRAQRFGLAMTRRRAAALVPVVGAAVGAGFNAVHADRLLTGSSMLFRARHLARRYDLDLHDLIGLNDQAAR